VVAGLADHALCLARDGDALALFVVPLAAEGVTLRPIPALADDHFNEVALDNVYVGADAVVGAPGQGWGIVVQTLVYERTGLDYYVKALRWYRAAVARWSGAGDLHATEPQARRTDRLRAAVTRVRRER